MITHSVWRVVRLFEYHFHCRTHQEHRHSIMGLTIYNVDHDTRLGLGILDPLIILLSDTHYAG
jgi:hypothetical protein